MEQLLKMIEDIQENPEWGTLTLQIHCSECNSIFNLNPQAIALAMHQSLSIWDYIKYIQISECSKCKQNIDQKTHENI